MFKKIGRWLLRGLAGGYVNPDMVDNPPPGPPVQPTPPARDYVKDRRKNKKTETNQEIIGVVTPTLVYRSASGDVVQDTFDTTTYPDKAIVRLQNTGTTTTTITGVSIRGKPIIRMAGTNGFVWDYSDYQSIEETGEQSIEIGNDYITSAAQCKMIGDYAWKELQAHKMYRLTLVGCHYEYEIGDIHTLTITYTLGSGTLESIDTDVEIVAYSHGKGIGGVGTTVLDTRIPSAVWAQTISNNAKLTTAGKPGWNIGRSTSVTVAASTYCGPADYYCDGTDDDVQIQAAIDYIESVGGGEVILTRGTFYVAETITIEGIVILRGDGDSTIISPIDANYGIIIHATSTATFKLFTFKIDSTNYTSTALSSYGITSRSANDCIIDNITISNISCSYPTNGQSIGMDIYGSGYTTVSNCVVRNISATLSVYGIYAADRVYACTLDNLVGGTNSWGLHSCKRCMLNRASNTATKYYLSYADSGTSNACADTADGGYNS